MHLGCALGCVDSKNYREPNTSVHLIQTPKDEAAIPGTLADMYSRSKLPTLIITDDNGTTFAAALKPTFGE
jgi:CO dehydrogenase/acetyl-CoA synthase epsilon subunit